MATMWKKYRVKLRFERIDGGIPEHPKVIRAWLDAHGLQDNEELAQRISDGVIKDEEMEEALRILTCSFLQEADGTPVIEARCVKAALKQAAGVMGAYGMMDGLKELMKEGTEVYPRLIRLEGGSGLKLEERAIHPKDAQGVERSAFKRTRYIEGCEATFDWDVTDRMLVMQALAETFGKAIGDKKEEPDSGPEESLRDDHGLKGGKTTEKETGKARKKGPISAPKKKSTLSVDLARLIMEYACKMTGFGSGRSQRSGKAELISIEEVTE